jgi:hypothetical protein
LSGNTVTPTQTNEIKLTQIRPHAGSQRAGFEEMTYQLFANDYANQGMAVRREGRGGDAGLEGFIEDDGGHVIIGHQAKFFIDRLERSNGNRSILPSAARSMTTARRARFANMSSRCYGI